MTQKKNDKEGGQERRTSIRKRVLQTFHVFIVVPSKGSHKIYLKDISEGGVGFFPDPSDIFEAGQTLECDFYVNPSLKIPLKIRVAHTGPDSIGCEFSEKSSKGYRTYTSFMNLLDELATFLE